ncbi:MAG: histidinol-phosphate transaminase [Candidatus Omnitrophica bacterium]|nr:histidinol-phosphate transaminase [Candidatus Omnitrophota bacterium]
MTLSAKKFLKNINIYKPGKPIEELQREFNIKEIYKLASNEIPFPPLYLGKVVLEELKNVNRYPEANCFYLRKALAKKLRVKEAELIFGNGSDELIILALRGFISKGDEVLVGFPTFLIYEIQSQVEGAKIKRVPFSNYRYDLKAMARAVTKKTKIVFIANPDNPHGTYLSHREVANFLEKIPRDILLFFDEAYYEFADKKDFPQTLSFLRKRGNIIISRTFSKAYGLAGLRIGYGITTPEIGQVLNKVREPFNVNRFAQKCAYSALFNEAFLRKVKVHIKKEKGYLYKEFKKIDLEFIESVTNSVLVNFKEDVTPLYDYLLRKGVIIRSLNPWGLKNFFRLTVGLHKENRKFIHYLRKYLEVE